MIQLTSKGAYVINEQIIVEDNTVLNESTKQKLSSQGIESLDKDTAKKNTIAYGILQKHNTSDNIKNLKIKFDALASHDITYVGIVQTARASGLKEFPVPYVLTNCHNSLCAVGGTINEDDHVFGLSAAKKYGGIFVPAHLAVIHTYMREMMAGCGKMILGSDSHTRYGALGTMAIGEGGPELVKQLLCRTYDIAAPEIIGVYLEGKPKKGVGPQDVALAIIGAVFKNGYVKNKVMEFIGPGIDSLSVDYRNGIDVMTTETTCLSSIWRTDEKVKNYYEIHGRADAFKSLKPGAVAYYDGLIKVDLSKIECMIALPFHPSNVYSIKELNENAADILRKVEVEAVKQLENPNLKFNLVDKITNGKLKMDQGVIAGCAGGTFENILEASRILNGHNTGVDEFLLNVYPGSQPVFSGLIEKGAINSLMTSGAIIKTAFCGPCFGAGDVPANGAISARHTTRNFPNREGSKPANGQIASVALMDARSIAATALNGGILTAATEVDYQDGDNSYTFKGDIYANRVYQGYGKAQADLNLKFGPNIVDWPKMNALTENVLLKVASVINDPVTTTDELIPSGETSSYRSNPLGLAEFTLSRKDPQYVSRAKDTQKIEVSRLKGYLKDVAASLTKEQLIALFGTETPTEEQLSELFGKTGVGSVIFAVKPGDGSAREQAASCQKVLGGWANIAVEYATKRYRSNVINWGMLPFTVSKEESAFNTGDLIFVENVRDAVSSGADSMKAKVIGTEGVREITLNIPNLTKDERDIILSGCLINYYAMNK